MRSRNDHDAGMTNAQELHVVCGSGQIGTLIRDRLVAQGHRVRMVRRGPAPKGETSPLVEWRSGDLADPRFAASVMEGAKVTYGVVTPPYEKWTTELLPLGRRLLAGAKESGTHLVWLENMYMLDPAAGPMKPGSPLAPRSVKGTLRATLAAEMAAMQKSGEARITIGRAADFFGPGTTLAAIFGDRFYERMASGQKGECFGDPDIDHAYAYTPDVADGLLALGRDPRAEGRIFHLPAAYQGPTRGLMEKLARGLGGKTDIVVAPTWVLKGVGLFVPIMREIAEMAYQWKTPYVVDDRAIREELGVTPTPVDEAVASTVAWAKAAYRKAA